MGKSIFQKMSDFINNMKTPKWFLRLLDLIKVILIEVFKTLGEEAMAHLKASIIEEANKDIPGQKKMENVVAKFREKYSLVSISDRSLRLLIEVLVNHLTKVKAIT